jgi:pimeloyl-ACP methyl ester carboxylesterase
MSAPANIILVHGAWADGSCWSGVIERLQADGYHVTAPQFPLTALADDVARLRHVLDLQDGPAIVAGHSYGGQIITALGADAPNVAGLVYIAAFGIDEGESLGALLGQGPPPPALEHLFTDPQGFIWLPEDDFVRHFASPPPRKRWANRGQPSAAPAVRRARLLAACASLPRAERSVRAVRVAVGVAALLIHLGRRLTRGGGAAAPGVHQDQRDDQAGRTAGHQDVADHVDVDAIGGPGHREAQDGADHDQDDASGDGHDCGSFSVRLRRRGKPRGTRAGRRTCLWSPG